MDHKCTITEQITREYRRFNTVGNQLTVRHLPPSEENEIDFISYFMYSVNDLCEYALRNCEDSNMVGITIRNGVNMRDKVIGISFRRKDHLSADMSLNVWEKVMQSISRFNVLDKLIL